jgi:ABC-type branched-subunit amino acid transport system substrate-binding protein
MFALNRRATLSCALALLLPLAATAQKKYDTGANDKEIVIGSFVPYSGPASAYGTTGKAEAAVFDKVNAEGGVNGRKIRFISLDDGYNPAKSVEVARKLVEEDEVLLLMGTWAPRRTPRSTSTSTRRRSRTCSSTAAPTNGATRRTSRGRWASSPRTPPRARPSPSTSWPPSRAPRSASSTRTTTSVRTT